nr:MAG: hypothetical protein BECKLFY1418A_GA0070994_10019 [Candidatus Kentron sp. LFY]
MPFCQKVYCSGVYSSILAGVHRFLIRDPGLRLVIPVFSCVSVIYLFPARLRKWVGFYETLVLFYYDESRRFETKLRLFFSVPRKCRLSLGRGSEIFRIRFIRSYGFDYLNKSFN